MKICGRERSDFERNASDPIRRLVTPLAQRGIQNATGQLLPPSHILGAVDDLQQSGHLDPDVAAAMRGHGGALPAAAIQPIIVQATQRAGLARYLTTAAVVPPDLPAQGPQPGTPAAMAPNTPADGSAALPPVRDPIRWQAAREDAKDHVDKLAAAAVASGQHNVAAAIRTIGGVPYSQQKSRLALDFMNRAAPGAESDYARSVLTDPLLRQAIVDLFVCLTMCGARWGEVANLRWDQVVLHPSGRGVFVTLFGFKTETERMVPVPAMFEEVLRRRQGAPDGAYVFGRGRSGKPPSHCCRPILAAIDECGLNDPSIVERHGWSVVQSLRHTFASWAIQGGADLSHIKDALGHTTVRMTLRYAYLSGRDNAARLALLMIA